MTQPKKAAQVATAPSRRRTTAKCPVCDKPAVQEHRPFCSRRCGDIDLGRWLGEHYRVPAEPADSAGAENHED